MYKKEQLTITTWQPRKTHQGRNDGNYWIKHLSESRKRLSNKLTEGRKKGASVCMVDCTASTVSRRNEQQKPESCQPVIHLKPFWHLWDKVSLCCWPQTCSLPASVFLVLRLQAWMNEHVQTFKTTDEIILKKMLATETNRLHWLNMGQTWGRSY